MLACYMASRPAIWPTRRIGLAGSNRPAPVTLSAGSPVRISPISLPSSTSHFTHLTHLTQNDRCPSTLERSV